MTNKYIHPNQIPASLWSAEGKHLILPAQLTEAWQKLLEENDLLELAKTKAKAGFEGGMSKEDTDKHLAWRYNGSCARLMLSMLDPHGELHDAADLYAKTFSGGKVFLADLPSGSGAATISILSTIFELRKSGVLPRIPLDLCILGAEISPTARDYFLSQLEDLSKPLQEQAIFVEYSVAHWDVLDPISNTDIIQTMTLSSQEVTARLLVLSNFSGFLEKEKKWKSASAQFEELFRHSRGEKSAAIWIEPKKNNVPNFLNRFVTWFKSKLPSVLGEKAEAPSVDWYATSSTMCQQPLKSGLFHVNLTVMRLDLPKNS